MFRAWRIGSVLGFPLELSPTFLLLLAVMFVWFGGLVGVLLVLLAFGSVLLHELGHAVVSRRLGVPVSSIELSFFGGAAKMAALPRTANHEIAIAAAGPAVSVALAAAGFVGHAATDLGLLRLLGWVNLGIAVFNLLPALPMDGGRILRALLTRRLDYVRATDASVKVARGFALAFVVGGLAMGSFQLLLLAPLLWIMGTRERLLARAMAHRYGYDRDGYREPGYGDVEVLGRDPFGFGGPDGWRGRPRPSAWPTADGGGPRVRRVVIRQRDGRFVIDVEE
jgi:Zn-dependent protease